MNPVISFFPEAYSSTGSKLMGRNVAGESFLRAYLEHARVDSFAALVRHPDDGQTFVRTVQGAGRREPVQVSLWGQSEALRSSGLLFHPDPGIDTYAWHRTPFGDTAWSVCGITHTLSSHWAMETVCGLLAAPVQPWDALICTSEAGRRVVTTLLEAQAEYLRERFAPRKLTVPMLPVIPLGVHSSDFTFSHDQRTQARQAVGADADTVVVLFAGRLSFHAKAHPLAMYQALELVARSSPGRRILLVEFGQYATPEIGHAFSAAAREGCPSVAVRHLHGGEPANRDIAWACADIFCSLSDSIQETFGITPVEAMAAGLPVVVSDWDGYRDTVRHGRDGFRIPTVMPAPGMGAELARRYATGADNYDYYCGHTGASISVDVSAAAHAINRLVMDADLRKRFGDSGRLRVKEAFDWAAIIPRYEALWAEQEERRRSQVAKPSPRRAPWPARMDPFHLFESYASRPLRPDTRLRLADGGLGVVLGRLARYMSLDMVRFAESVLLTESEMLTVLGAAGPAGRPAEELVAVLAVDRRDCAFRSLAWLLKLGLLSIEA